MWNIYVKMFKLTGVLKQDSHQDIQMASISAVKYENSGMTPARNMDQFLAGIQSSYSFCYKDLDLLFNMLLKTLTQCHTA